MKNGLCTRWRIAQVLETRTYIEAELSELLCQTIYFPE